MILDIDFGMGYKMMRPHTRYKWEVECEYMGCRDHSTHARFTATGPEKHYCRKHFEQAVLLFGEHEEKQHVEE